MLSSGTLNWCILSAPSSVPGTLGYDDSVRVRTLLQDQLKIEDRHPLIGAYRL